MAFRNMQLVLLFSSLFLVSVGFGIVIPLLPFLALEMGGSSVDMGFLLTVWAMAQFIVAPRWGAFSDRAGRRPGIIVGLIGFGIAFLLMGLSTQLWMLYAARIIGGIMAASTMPSVQAYVADVTGPQDRARNMGYMGAAFGLGFMLGPSIGAVMAPLGMQFIFFCAAISGWITALLIYFLLPEPEERTTSGPPGGSSLKALRLALGKPYACLLWLPLLMSFAGSALFTAMGFFLMDRFGAREFEVGIAFTVNGGMGVITQGLLLSWFLSRMGELRTLRMALVISIIGFIGFSFAPHFLVLLIFVAAISLGQGVSRPVMTSLLSRTTDMGQGMTMGLMGSFESLGRVIGPLWAGMAYVWSMEAPYLSAAAACLIGIHMVNRAYVCMETQHPATPPAPRPHPQPPSYS